LESRKLKAQTQKQKLGKQKDESRQSKSRNWESRKQKWITDHWLLMVERLGCLRSVVVW
jgi:hypothetical protein